MTTYSLPLTAEGAVTEPTGVLDLVVPSAESVEYFDIGPVNVLELPDIGWLMADGVNRPRIVTRGTVYDVGGIAPSTAPTLTASGTKATATLTGDGGAPSTDLADGDQINLGSGANLMSVVFKTTLDTGFLSDIVIQVKRGTSFVNTMSNLEAAIEHSGTEGTEYHSGYIYNNGGTDTNITETTGIEFDSRTSNTFVFRAADPGTAGNDLLATEITDSGGVYSISAFSGGAAGTGTAPASGTYRYFYTWYRSADGAETGRSPIATVDNTQSQNITVSVLTASADTTFDYTRVYRTEKEGVEFFLSGAIARAGTEYTDDVSDATLAVSIPWNELLHRAYVEGRPPRGRALALWKGSAWSTGAHLAAEYSKGTVAVSNGSATATFSVSGVTTRMENRTFVVDSTSEEYRIISVNEGGPTAALDRVYEGSSDGTATFKIKDTYDAARLQRSVPFLYNQWPEDESPGRVDTDDVEGGTALLATRNRLFAFSKTSTVAVTGEGPDSWELTKVSGDVGCVAPGMVVPVEGGGIFLSQDGFYAISPDGLLANISSPKTPKRTVAQGIDATVNRIEWANVDHGYSTYDKVEGLVLFGVPLDGASVPNYEIVFDVQNATWALYKRSEFTTHSNITLPGGNLALLAGDRDGNVWHTGIGESDGFYGTEAVQTLSGAQTVRVLTVSGTPFSTTGDGEEGKPVVVLYADGATVAYGKVASNTTSALTLAEDLDTAPAADDQIVLGGIAWQWVTGFTTFGEEYRTKNVRTATIRHAPISRGDYFFSFAADGGSFALASTGTSVGDLTDSDGKVRHRVDWPGDTHAFGCRGFKPGGRAVIRGGVFDLVMRESGSL